METETELPELPPSDPEVLARYRFTDEQLKKVAMDLANGLIFTHLHIPPEDGWLVRSVFMPFGLGAIPSGLNPNDIGLIYEYVNKAGERGINGYPIFHSYKMILTEQRLRLFDMYEEYAKLVGTFLSPSKDVQDATSGLETNDCGLITRDPETSGG